MLEYLSISWSWNEASETLKFALEWYKGIVEKIFFLRSTEVDSTQTCRISFLKN